MNKLAVVTVALLSATWSASSSERLITVACTPTVNVTIPKATTNRAPMTRDRRSEVVQVYWDISKSMRDFAARRTAHGHTAQADDLAAVVNALDSNVLLQAHAKSVEQYGVGESIAALPSARSALSPHANRTVLHLAAEQIGAALANGTAQAALIVSDLEVDTPPRTSKNAAVCGGVPLPSTPEAGSLFGRCFENAVLASGASALTRANLLVHVFRKNSHDRELFILLLAADRDFGHRISDEVVRRIGFERQVVFDSGAIAAANLRGCRLSAPSREVLRTADGCGVKCYEADTVVQAECDIQRPASDAWISPVANVANAVGYEVRKRKPGDPDDRAVARFIIPCTARPGLFDVSIPYAWQVRTPWSQAGGRTFAQTASVRDLFDSLDDAIVRLVAPRTLRIGAHLAQ